ncbi:MAG TPA: CBS domain-containing protein [Candidatus Limnocylindrales bacterium]|nr:CBS domain-containing protein [Candidatus Limnocylindrales bacterium]
MLCPVCRHDNFEGEDNCENCGADLRTSDIPAQAVDYRGRLLGEHLDALDAAAPQTVDASADAADAIALMHESGVDCVLVTDHGRLVGIFTDRDAVLKVAGRPVGPCPITEVMTRDPVLLRHDDPIAVAIHKMAVGGFRHIPIVDGGWLPTGVVSAKDVFRHIASIIG